MAYKILSPTTTTKKTFTKVIVELKDTKQVGVLTDASIVSGAAKIENDSSGKFRGIKLFQSGGEFSIERGQFKVLSESEVKTRTELFKQ